MANTRRPSTARKPPTKAVQAEKDEALEEGLTITVDGTAYTVRTGDLSALDTRALRKELGMSFVGLLDAFRKDPDIDLIAGVMWLSRRAKGEFSLTYDEVAGDLGYDLDISFDGQEEPDAPEA